MAKQTFTFRGMTFPGVRKVGGDGTIGAAEPDQTGTVEVTVNLSEIAHILGYRAAKSKSKKATALGDHVVVKFFPNT